MINHVVDPDEVLARTMELAYRLAAGPTAHHAMTKQAVFKGMQGDSFEAALLESWGQSKALASEDFQEGLLAFKEKREPKFTGR
jgi:2-(1,2-epoxy-1,2-dihydrophenyl)acetyl-CoA isomerase